MDMNFKILFFIFIFSILSISCVYSQEAEGDEKKSEVPELVLQLGHLGPVTCVEFSPDD